MRLWNKWKAHRNAVGTAEIIPDDITKVSTETLQYWMCQYVLEVRRKDGSVYPANTLHHLCCGVMCHLWESGWHQIDIFKDPTFSKF